MSRPPDLRSHPALKAVDSRAVERAASLVRERLALHSLGEHVRFCFEHTSEDNDLLSKVAFAYEIAAIEGLGELSRPSGEDAALRNQTVSAASFAFDIMRLLPIPKRTHERLFFVLKTSAMACCGDRWPDLRRWYSDNPDMLRIPDPDSKWDRRLLCGIFDCWIRLFEMRSTAAINQVANIINGLRREQDSFEEKMFDGERDGRAVAFHLAAMYHWAKATEILAEYITSGTPADPFAQVDKHLDAATTAVDASGDRHTFTILRWLHAAGRIMITNSLWWATRSVNSLVSEFVRSLTRRGSNALFELLPPQRTALLSGRLLDPAKTAVVANLPTSSGKTLLAQLRILQALNQFRSDGGWIAYVAPTRALTAQITRTFRRDLEVVGVRTEQLTSAVEIDAFEEDVLAEEHSFDVLVSTPEKLSLVIRNDKIQRPLTLAVIDEAHNIESNDRGLRIELLLSTIKRKYGGASFLLLMPDGGDTSSLVGWLAQDTGAGQSISQGTSWRPNERLVGIYRAVPDDSVNAGWSLQYETLSTAKNTVHLNGTCPVGHPKPVDVPRSTVLKKDKQAGTGIQAAAMATSLSPLGTSIAFVRQTRDAWSAARKAAGALERLDPISDDIQMVQDFLRTEISPEFELVDMLERGVGVHHAGLSDETRALMEWLAERGHLRVLCTTSTIAQGINFPVSSVFLQSLYLPRGRSSVRMASRDFWNLAGRAGRIYQDSIGVVGIADGNRHEEVAEFVRASIDPVSSRMAVMLDGLDNDGDLDALPRHMLDSEWDDFRGYVAQLWAEKKNLEDVLAESELLLRQTYGFTTLRNDPKMKKRSNALLGATQEYIRTLAKMPRAALLANSTGFSPEGARTAILQMRQNRTTTLDWTPESLFDSGGKMADLFGVMLEVPQLKKQLAGAGNDSMDKDTLAGITLDWVNGHGISDIAKSYFSNDEHTQSLTNACKVVYKSIVGVGSWGVSTLSNASGLDYENMPETERRRINTLPAMVYHGARTEDAVLMRINAAPRSAASALGKMYRDSGRERTVRGARKFLQDLDANDWGRIRPAGAMLSGDRYRSVWRVLSGEADTQA